MSEIPIHEQIRELQNSNLNKDQIQQLVNEAIILIAIEWVIGGIVLLSK